MESTNTTERRHTMDELIFGYALVGTHKSNGKPYRSHIYSTLNGPYNLQAMTRSNLDDIKIVKLVGVEVIVDSEFEEV